MSKADRTRRRRIVVPLAPLLLIAGTVFGLTTGSVPIPLRDIFDILLGGPHSEFKTILMDVRLPRVLVGVLVGACLAASGALLQGIMRNPLADPGIIGVSAGGGLAAVVTLVLLPQLSYLLPPAAFAGSLVAALLIYTLSWDNGASPVKIVLAGVAVSALLGAIMNGIMVVHSDRIQAVIPWLAGGLNGRSWHHLSFMLPYALAGLALTVPAIKPANVLLLGDKTAKLLGQRVELQRLLLLALAALLAGTAVSVAGLVGFVGLVVPHAVRLLIGDDYRYLMPVSIASGGALVVTADTVARTWFDPAELPVGILLACIGAPFFLYLLRKRSGVR